MRRVAHVSTLERNARGYISDNASGDRCVYTAPHRCRAAMVCAAPKSPSACNACPHFKASAEGMVETARFTSCAASRNSPVRASSAANSSPGGRFTGNTFGSTEKGSGASTDSSCSRSEASRP